MTTNKLTVKDIYDAMQQIGSALALDSQASNTEQRELCVKVEAFIADLIHENLALYTLIDSYKMAAIKPYKEPAND